MAVGLLWVVGCLAGSGPVIRGDNPAPGQAATAGTIIDAGHYQDWGRGGLHDHYRPTVRYVVDGAEYDVTYDRTTREPALGSPVEVTYDLDSPGQASIPLTDGERWEAVVLTCLGAVFGAWAYLAQLRPARRAMRRLAEERDAPRTSADVPPVVRGHARRAV